MCIDIWYIVSRHVYFPYILLSTSIYIDVILGEWYIIINREIFSSPNYHGIRVIPLLIVVVRYQQACAGPCSHSVCLAPSHFRLGLSLHLPLLSTWAVSYSNAASVTLLQNSCSQVLVSPSTSVLFMHVSSVITSALHGRFCLPFLSSTRDVNERWLHYSRRQRELFDEWWLHHYRRRPEMIDERIFKLLIFDSPWVWGRTLTGMWYIVSKHVYRYVIYYI